MKYLVPILLAGCAVHRQEPWHPPPSMAEQFQEPETEPVRVVTPVEPAKHVADEPPCEAAPQARIDALTVELAEAKANREAWTKTHCTPAIGRHVWYDARGFKYESGTTPLWDCDGRLVDVLTSNEESRIVTSLVLARTDLKKCAEKIGPFYHSR